MLQTMRHWAQSWVFKGLMLLLVISFGIWGIGDIFRGNSLQSTVAKVGAVAITAQQLNHEFEQDLMQARQRFRQEITPQQAKQMGFMDRSLEAIIQRSLVDQEANKLGIDVNGQAVIDRVAAQPQFREKDGKFNAKLFRQLLEQAHLTEQEFVEQGRQDMVRHQLIDVLQDGNKPSDIIIETLAKARGQKRFFDIVTINNNSVSGISTPNDEILHDFWQKNSQSYTAPEYRNGTIALLTIDEIAKNIEISDADVKKEFAAKSDDFIKPERRDIIQVLLQDEKEADKVAGLAKASNNLEEAAKTSGHNVVPLNQVDQKTLLPELAKPVFSLQNGQISDPIKSSLGWHVVQIKKVVASKEPDFDEVKNDLRESMKHDQAVEAITQMVNQLDDELAAGHTLEDIADSMKLRLVKLPPIDSEGNTLDGKVPSEFPNKPDVLKTIYAQNSGEVSPVVEDKQGNYYVVRTDDVVPTTVKPFEKVKSAVATDWKVAEQNKAASDKAEKIADLIRKGKTPDSFAANGLDVHTSQAVSLLGDKDPTIPDSVLPQIMKIKKDEVITAAAPNKHLVIRLNKIVDSDISENKAAKIKIASELAHNIPDEMTAQYIQYLRSVYPVKIYQDVLDSLQQPGS